MREPKHSKKFFLTAALCNAQLQMPMPVFTQMVIDIATEHANILDIGYTYMISHNAAWVLSRVTAQMERFPRFNETFSMTTWIISLNRFYSERAIRFDDDEGNVIGWVRTTWVAIDIASRRPINLLTLFPDGVPMPEMDMPLEPPPRIPRLEQADLSREHVFLASDIDCNRHVNTNRYVEQIINQWDLDFYDSHSISLFDITFHAEALFGEKVTVRHHIDGDDAIAQIENADGKILTAAHIVFKS
ncbi:MAG: acyl-[acyl-carrier-protein] thioesterase [Muribaculaceae bacterium]